MTNKYENIDFDFGCPSRFDLEDCITKQLDIVEDIRTVIENTIEGNASNVKDEDYLVNTLQGIINLHEMKYEKLWNTFTALFRLDSYSDLMYTEDVDNQDFYEEN
jgi:hypothetical protein